MFDRYYYGAKGKWWFRLGVALGAGLVAAFQ